MSFDQNQDNTVREISINNGCFHVDLLSGLRLSGPMMSEEDMLRSMARNPNMIVSGSEAMATTALAFG